MAKKCRLCGGDVPDDRWASSWYCSEEHYYSAKKKRSNNRYYKLKEQSDHIRKNEAILEMLLIATQLSAVIKLEDLSKAGLDLGFSTGEIAGRNGDIWKMIGDHAYYIDPQTKKVSLWKRN